MPSKADNAPKEAQEPKDKHLKDDKAMELGKASVAESKKPKNKK